MNGECTEHMKGDQIGNGVNCAAISLGKYGGVGVLCEIVVLPYDENIDRQLHHEFCQE